LPDYTSDGWSGDKAAGSVFCLLADGAVLARLYIATSGGSLFIEIDVPEWLLEVPPGDERAFHIDFSGSHSGVQAVVALLGQLWLQERAVVYAKCSSMEGLKCFQDRCNRPLCHPSVVGNPFLPKLRKK
jgi:hypothetical protein